MVFVLALCFWLLCFSRSPWNHIISVHYEPEAYYSIGFYCRIHTASKYLHYDLARAIRRWSKKKLEWGLDAPFTPQDRLPLAIAMVIKSGNRRKSKRYRLVVARREKLRLLQRVLAVLDANIATSSAFFPCAISKEYLYGSATDRYRSSLWLCAAFEFFFLDGAICLSAGHQL